MDAELPADSTAVRRAREIVRTALIGWPAGRIEDAELIVSELVANAVRHGAPPFSIDVRLEVGHAVIELTDRGPGFDGPWPAALEPRRQAPHGDLDADPEREIGGEGGRGLELVNQLAGAWGWTQSEGRVSFWAELAP